MGKVATCKKRECGILESEKEIKRLCVAYCSKRNMRACGPHRAASPTAMDLFNYK